MNTYADLEARWKALRRRGDAAVREVACAGAPRTLLCAEIGEAHLPAIAVASGVHGDEPAAPWALLQLVEDRELDPRFSYRVWPCTNPTGYEKGTRESVDGVDVNRSFGRGGQTPEARAIVMANRNRKFGISFDLHEDVDADGFYCYEYGSPQLGRAMVDAVRVAGFPIQDLAQCDLGAPFTAAHLDDGVVRPSPASEIDALGGLSYNLALARHAAECALTLETPARLQWQDRLTIHRIAVKAAIAAFAKHKSYG